MKPVTFVKNGKRSLAVFLLDEPLGRYACIYDIDTQF